MSRITHRMLIAGMASLLLALPVSGDAQGRGGSRGGAPHPPVVSRPLPVPLVRGQVVFIGGYFYDPFFGPYPWWPRTAYPYWYFPVYATRAELRLLVEPEDAALYVDGFYAGTVDDFNGVFQALPLPPGGHEIAIYLEGYRTARWNVYLRAGSTFKLRETLARLAPGETSELPRTAPPVPPPPAGTYSAPVTPPRAQPAPAPVAVEAVGFGVLVLRVRPADAEVSVDGERWLSSAEGEFTIQVPVGRHRVQVSAPGRERFSTEVEVREGQTSALDVMLTRPTR